MFKCLLIVAQCLYDVLFCSVLFCRPTTTTGEKKYRRENAYKSGYIGVDLFAEVQDAKCRV